MAFGSFPTHSHTLDHFMKKIALLMALVAVHAQAQTVETSAPDPGERPSYSFLDPIGDFANDSILQPKTPFELVPGKDPNGWGFVFEPYGWAMGIEGKTGVGGFPAMSVEQSAINALRHLDWAIFGTGEIRKGRWGVVGDGYYAALSGSGDLGGNLYKDGSIQLQQAIASLALAYRIIDDRRGFIDIYAGARYNFLGVQMDLSTDSAGINALGVGISDAVASKISSAVQAKLDTAKPEIAAAVAAAAEARLDSIRSQAAAAAVALPTEQAQVAAVKALASANVAFTVESDLSNELFASQSKTKQSVESLKVLERLAGDSRGRSRGNHRSDKPSVLERDARGRSRDSRRSEKPRELERDSRIASQRASDARRLELQKNALRSLDRKDLRGVLASSKGAIREFIRAQAELEVAKIAGTVTSALQSRANAAKAKLAKSISNALEDSLPTHAAGDEWWIDPIVGLRGQLNLTRWLFLAAQADVGGFGAGSQITWNTQATIGVNFTRNVFAELGYRYMYVDYESDGFLYNMNSYGLYSSIGFKF